MYSVAVTRDFIASHYLIGGDWGAENDPHAHHYRVEVCLEGEELDRHNYLVDIVDIERALEALVGHYRDKMLNDLSEFKGENPSVELFCQVFCVRFAEDISARNIRAITTRIWENDIAWASYRLER